MIHIIKVLNAHEFDGIDITQEEFDCLAKALELSTFKHTIKYTKDGKECIDYVE